jgi:hypothetical protein
MNKCGGRSSFVVHRSFPQCLDARCRVVVAGGGCAPLQLTCTRDGSQSVQPMPSDPVCGYVIVAPFASTNVK